MFDRDTPLRELNHADLQDILFVDANGANPRQCSVECYEGEIDASLFTFRIKDGYKIRLIELVDLETTVDELVQMYSKLQELEQQTV